MRRHDSRPCLRVALAGALVLLACSSGPPPPTGRNPHPAPQPPVPSAVDDEPAVTVLPPPSPFVLAPAGERPHELDRTLWRCDNGAIVAFWGDHFIKTDPDFAMLAMGVSQIFARSHFALRYGPTGTFTPTGIYSVALRRTEWPYGQRPPVDYDEPPLFYSYTLVNDHLFMLRAGRLEPLECFGKVFGPELTEYLEEQFGAAQVPR
jgi:hypothetical protein